jgi:hypothetical protein
MNLTKQRDLKPPGSNVTSAMTARLSGDLGGAVLTPGNYESAEPLIIQMGDLTLDAQGDDDVTWIFHLGSFFTTIGGRGGNIVLTGGAKAKNIFWQIDRLARIGEGTTFKGNILTKLSKQPRQKLSDAASNSETLPGPIEYSSNTYKRYVDKTINKFAPLPTTD